MRSEAACSPASRVRGVDSVPLALVRTRDREVEGVLTCREGQVLVQVGRGCTWSEGWHAGGRWSSRTGCADHPGLAPTSPRASPIVPCPPLSYSYFLHSCRSSSKHLAVPSGALGRGAQCLTPCPPPPRRAWGILFPPGCSVWRGLHRPHPTPNGQGQRPLRASGEEQGMSGEGRACRDLAGSPPAPGPSTADSPLTGTSSLSCHPGRTLQGWLHGHRREGSVSVWPGGASGVGRGQQAALDSGALWLRVRGSLVTEHGFLWKGVLLPASQDRWSSGHAGANQEGTSRP